VIQGSLDGIADCHVVRTVHLRSCDEESVVSLQAHVLGLSLIEDSVAEPTDMAEFEEGYVHDHPH
jgi:hypothetical protein